MDYAIPRETFWRTASRITVSAHIFGILANILMLVWLLHYREGLDLDSANPYRVFNVHPFLMFFGFIFLSGEDRITQKFVHGFLNLSALVLGIVGIHAAFKFHNKANIVDMYSLHSWIGIGTFCIFILQWLFGFSLFVFPKASAVTRARLSPWHVFGGRTLLYMAICAAETGLMQKFTFMQLTNNRESYLINFLALAILLFGITTGAGASMAKGGRSFQITAAPVTVFAHLLVISIATLVLVWLIKFREGFAFKSHIKAKIFNATIIVYKTIPAKRQTQKATHLILHFIALVAGILGVYAVFKFHHELYMPDMYTLHSWIGLSTICLFGLQWLLAFFSFVYPGAESARRSRMVPWHVFFGVVIFFMTIVTAETGLTQKFFSLELQRSQEALIINFTGLLILLLGISVGLIIILPRRM
ncbi:cytochrome b561, eukaryote [Cynara cardunculus var. scolymus]|uniref:ascorbate ferrireductase (transmembrane) n=1 Tax=Cynara cardunculus var. scolymus TaxID=59895 RepID=A0A124SAW4_CYNCS|nr:cytochrome b561, eukaryote [Cynara cardunculus var. scolymus]